MGGVSAMLRTVELKAVLVLRDHRLDRKQRPDYDQLYVWWVVEGGQGREGGGQSGVAGNGTCGEGLRGKDSMGHSPE